MDDPRDGIERSTAAGWPGAGAALPAPPPRRRRRWTSAALATLAAVALVEGGVIVGRSSSGDDATDVAATSAVVTSASSSSTTDLSAVIATAVRSVVSVDARTTVTGPFGTAASAESQGSGVIVADGIVVTNAHVVQGASSVTVRYGDTGDEPRATVLGTDSTHDLAVLSVDTGDRPAIAIGSSSGLALGDTVVALGYPLGLGSTATSGIVSGLDRTIDVSNGSSVEHLVGLLQTDAAINPGNSGGPLIDAEGRLVGINTAGASAAAAENIGFAIAIDRALPIVRQLSGTSV